METVITSSVLILIIAGLRCLLRGKISSRLQYALWILVAIRLLLPFSLFESPFGVMNAIPNAQVHPAAFLLQKVSDDPGRTALPENGVPKPQNDQTAPLHSSGAANGTDWEAMAQFARLCGMILSGAFFTSSNIHLHRKLKRNRKQMEIPQCPLPVYLTDSLPSPCLYGIGKPVIYVTPESLFDKKRTEYVIAHELTHHRQKDHIWSVVRILCLCIHWFNPLVWLAAVLSRRDSELACDEGTLHRIGRENRVEYGQTLIEMMTAPAKPSDLFCCATTMTGGKREMAERMKRIVRQPKTLMITLAAVVAAMVAAVAFTFGGAAGKIPIVLPLSSEVTGITIEQTNEGESLGIIHTSQKTDVEQILIALADTDKTSRKSINDAPNRKDYFQVDMESTDARTFYLYNDGTKYFVEEPYVGIYRVDRETSVAIARIYTANGGAELDNLQELWVSRTPYVGDNSAVGKLLGLLPLPEGLRHDHFALRTGGGERGLEWVLKGEKNVPFDMQEAEKDARLLFALIDNLEDFYITVGDPSEDGMQIHHDRLWADQAVGCDIRDYAESPERLQELIDFPVVETPSYRIARLRKNGGFVFDNSPKNQELAEAITMDYMVKSAAWEGMDIATLEECYLIRRTLPDTGEVHDFYAYLLGDDTTALEAGTAVLQAGTDGRYSVISQDLYRELETCFP